ncbi:MAG: tryptophan synthase subunit alpha [Tepidisphaeraceae bacterium]|jgi:tryptophan synthase alpha chain
MPTISQSISAARQSGIALIPFVPAGYPDLATTTAVIREMDAAGAAAIEVGFPFSDPIADGPVIQQAFTAALARKVHVADILASIGSLRGKISAPLVGMLSYSIVFRYGREKFCADAKSAGFSGLILPDLTPPDADSVCKMVRDAGLDTILLIAPTTAPERRKQIARLSSGFVYYLSVTGITGARDVLPPDIGQNVQQIKQLTDCPVCVGFGISQRQHMIDLSRVADGAIVGSAIVKRMIEHAGDGPETIANSVGQFCRELLGK